MIGTNIDKFYLYLKPITDVLLERTKPKLQETLEKITRKTNRGSHIYCSLKLKSVGKLVFCSTKFRGMNFSL